MDHEAIEREVQRLNDKRSRLMAEVDLVEREIGRVQEKCAHTKPLHPPNAWWCEYCGAEIKKTA